MTRNMCGRSFGSRPYALERSLGSRPNVLGFGGAIVLTCGPPAVAPLETCSPHVLENVYEPNACQPLDRRFSAAITTPLYVSEYPSGFVNRKRRAPGELTITDTGTVRSGKVRVSATY